LPQAATDATATTSTAFGHTEASHGVAESKVIFLTGLTSFLRT